ncbi:Helicase associated domain protein [Streptomyces sp. NPDC059578]|uniref:DEAD/DEAH box helicase n=1 Tax=Streptomyces sp. NPDC059578 TaxID=3346874 RepID=UPI0036D15D52
MIEEIRLRPHQEEAVQAIVSGLEIRPGTRMPEKGMRGVVVAACGTGKTFIAASSALRIAPHGRILVIVPTLELLAQTAQEWRTFGHTGPAVAVCSMDDDPRLHSLGIRTTTSPPQLGLWHGSGPVTVYATYASLPVIISAHEGEYGLPMDVWDLVLVDEAHRTSGHMGKAWAAVHDQDCIPAMRRLYLTATPRIWEERPPRRWQRGADERPARDSLPEEMACSMDDQAVFGPILWEMPLGDAINRGLLARYQIVVTEVRDPHLTPERLLGEDRGSEEVRGERLAVMQAALLRSMTDHTLSKCITFHHRTIEARAFSEGLERVAAQLHADDPDSYPETVWTGWLSGEHDTALRANSLRAFESTARRAVISNCRVLTEGVDVPDVDSVALIDPKGSVVDVVQAIGRALRQRPGAGKVATLIVPILLGADETDEDMPYSVSYRPLVKVLGALRAHDERAVEMLAYPQDSLKRTRPEGTVLGDEPEDGAEETRTLLRFGAHRDPALVSQLVRYNLLEPENAYWQAGYRAAQAYARREGHLSVPWGHTEGENAYPLGRWLSDQRRELRAGRIPGGRAGDLDALGMVWDPTDAVWHENLEAARAWHATYGTLAAPVTAAMLGRPVGQWLANCRKKGGLGSGERAERRERLLAAIDSDWAPAWPVDWQRHFAALRSVVVEGSVLGHVEPGAMVHGMDVGRWVAAQREPGAWRALSGEQRERLVALGVEPVVEPVAPVRRAGGRAEAWERGARALEAWVAREGTVVVPRGHQEQDDEGLVRLGVWVANQRARRAKLSVEQRERLAGLGALWAAEE